MTQYAVYVKKDFFGYVEADNYDDAVIEAEEMLIDGMEVVEEEQIEK